METRTGASEFQKETFLESDWCLIRRFSAHFLIERIMLSLLAKLKAQGNNNRLQESLQSDLEDEQTVQREFLRAAQDLEAQIAKCDGILTQGPNAITSEDREIIDKIAKEFTVAAAALQSQLNDLAHANMESREETNSLLTQFDQLANGEQSRTPSSVGPSSPRRSSLRIPRTPRATTPR